MTLTMQKITFWFFGAIAAIPLPILHRIGNFLGSIGYCFLPKKLRDTISGNVDSAGIISDKLARHTLIKAVCQESIKGGFELPVAWMRSSEDIVDLFKAVHGWEHVQTALEKNEGLLLITPHIGSYDLAGRYISHHLPFPLTAMYRPPKQKWLDEVMNAGRVRDKGRTAPTNLQGVKQVMKALRAAEATIVLPDQVPHGADGIWVNFFGRPAYTMTLAGKLANMKNVSTLFFCGERLPNGQGFVLHIEPMQGELTGNAVKDTQLINDNVEIWVKRFPAQYLFSYKRYKQPAGAPPRPE